MKKILWSVDAFQKDEKIYRNTVGILKNLSRKNNVQITPVYILSDGLLGLSIPLESLKSNFYEPALKAMNLKIKKLRAEGLNVKDPEIITRSLSSTSDAVNSLCKLAKSMKADLIVCSSHARKGVKRMILGSFAETLFLVSKTPVLMVTPNTQSDSNGRKILFSTDFSALSRKAFEKVVDYAHSTDSAITVYHAISYPGDPVVQSGVFLLGGGWVPINTHFEDIENERKAIGKKWLEFAKKKKVKADLVVENWCRSVPDGVLKAAKKKKYSMIAMASQSGKVESALLGSVSRQILRNSPVPMLVIHETK